MTGIIGMRTQSSGITKEPPSRGNINYKTLIGGWPPRITVDHADQGTRTRVDGWHCEHKVKARDVA